jgi:DNA-binding XRE family transcriptional regulator
MGEIVPLRPNPVPGFPLAPVPAEDREPLWRELVGEQLRQRRLQRQERLVDVAERAGVSPQYLSEVERGLKDPSSEMLAAVAGSLELTVRDLSTRAARLSGSAGPTLCLAA